ncbi:MAG: hypothetical protein HOV86_03005 [Thermoactinospora sp.]|nr:hypothetical protein [Thermoactinospora sp.]
MSVLTALARIEAVRQGRAQRIAAVRHVHLAERPMVVIPLGLAGEANAPLGALVGTDREHPALLTVPQPRNRDLRFAFAAELAGLLVPYLEGFSADAETVEPKRGEPYERSLDAPQLIVPNRPGAAFLKLLGRSTRFRRTDGPYPVDPSVPSLGRWLTYLADRSEHPGSCLLLPATEALSLHWATGQSSLEDANLGALLAWITDGPQAALRAEDPAHLPPAGPATDPGFDNAVLEPLIRAHDEGTPVEEKIADALLTQLEPTWRLVWQAVDLLREIPAGASVASRWEGDRASYTGFAASFAESHPQPRRDSAVAAAARLDKLERAQAGYEVARAFDDPLLMAEHRLKGQAYTGEVVDADPGRIVDSDKNRKLLRPLVTVSTTDPVRLAAGDEVTCVERPELGGTVHSLDGALITVEISKGMGTLTKPAPLPEGRVAFTTLKRDFQQPATFPEREETPWTHGGPPPEYVPAEEDAVEEWA